MADPTTPMHVPVLLAPVLAAAAGARRAVDATLGDGGHAEALRHAGAEVLGIDRDPAAIAVRRRRGLSPRLHPARFGRLVPATGRDGAGFYFPTGRVTGHVDGLGRSVRGR